MNDSDFVQALREQDPAAVQHLAECFLPSVWRFVYVRVDGDRHLAEDIVSEAALALVRAAAAGSAIENPSAWLRSVANHKVQDHYRAAARVRHLIDQGRQAEDTAEDNDPAARQELTERRREIRRVMDELPERHRLALEWKYIDKLSVREIAGRLETTEKAAESILFRARREFRDKLAGEEQGEQDEDEGESHRSNGRPKGNSSRDAGANGREETLNGNSVPSKQ